MTADDGPRTGRMLTRIDLHLASNGDAGIVDHNELGTASAPWLAALSAPGSDR